MSFERNPNSSSLINKAIRMFPFFQKHLYLECGPSAAIPLPTQQPTSILHNSLTNATVASLLLFQVGSPAPPSFPVQKRIKPDAERRIKGIPLSKSGPSEDPQLHLVTPIPDHKSTNQPSRFCQDYSSRLVRLLLPVLPPTNAFKRMLDAGSKGSPSDLAQLCLAVGLQGHLGSGAFPLAVRGELYRAHFFSEDE